MAKHKSKSAKTGPNLFDDAPITFGQKFLERHAGYIMSDPAIALVELVANCYDAGATRVNIQWPNDYDGIFEIADNGVGMTSSSSGHMPGCSICIGRSSLPHL